MALQPSPAALPPRRPGPVPDPRFLELFGHGRAAADVLLAGVPFDGAVIGRKGCREGPTAIREAMRFLATHDPVRGVDLAGLRLHDAGDVLLPWDAGVLDAHRLVREEARSLFAAGKPLVLLGGDNSLSAPHVQALRDARGGRIGLVVLDAHYDLRPVPPDGIPTSGTPYRRLIEEGVVAPANLAEVGIRPYANTKALADYAAQKGVHVVTVAQVRQQGVADAAAGALARAAAGVDHVLLSVDIDGLDQSIASGCSAPGAGGLTFDEASAVVHAVAAHPLCRGMDLVEVAPSLDPTGNTARTAAQLVAAFAGGLTCRPRA
ncbi:MAG TPA: agmatinase family protein [Candidatus Thermoplasmatota archaeon]|nr:agmatinase family protein [Candidatus Thermoplasmatota archaeon]